MQVCNNWLHTLTSNKDLFKTRMEKELGSEDAQRSEVGQLSRSFQSNQPTPSPIRDRSGRPDNMEDGRKTSRLKRSMVILFFEEPSSSERTGRPEVNQTRSAEDSKSLNVEQTHDRTGRPVTDTAAAQDDSQVCHEANTLNVDDEVLRKRMEKSIVHDENHEPMVLNEADMEFKIPDYHIPF